jgi:ABC-type dipeptide/oligopeptide/nickel transport system permease component
MGRCIQIISAAVISFGGAAFIVRWFVNISANHLSEKMLRKYDAELNKDIERYKHELQLETEKYRQKTEKIVFVTRKQFETEFSAYQSLFDNLFDFSVCTRTLFLFSICFQRGKWREKTNIKNVIRIFDWHLTHFQKSWRKMPHYSEIPL